MFPWEANRNSKLTRDSYTILKNNIKMMNACMGKKIDYV